MMFAMELKTKSKQKNGGKENDYEKITWKLNLNHMMTYH